VLGVRGAAGGGLDEKGSLNMTAIQQTPVLLPPAAADRAAGVRLKVKDERSSIKNRSEQSIYPTQKSVLKTAATPHSGSESGDPECNGGSQKCECQDRCQGDEPSGHGILHHRQTFFIAQKRNQMFTHIYSSYR